MVMVGFWFREWLCLRDKDHWAFPDSWEGVEAISEPLTAVCIHVIPTSSMFKCLKTSGFHALQTILFPPRHSHSTPWTPYCPFSLSFSLRLSFLSSKLGYLLHKKAELSGRHSSKTSSETHDFVWGYSHQKRPLPAKGVSKDVHPVSSLTAQPCVERQQEQI